MTEYILDEVRKEREYQKEKWGFKADTQLNTPNDFVSYISHHSTKWFEGGFEPYPPEVVDEYRKQMVKVAALAVAAIEGLDYQRGNNGNAFFEEDE